MRVCFWSFNYFINSIIPTGPPTCIIKQLAGVACDVGGVEAALEHEDKFPVKSRVDGRLSVVDTA